MSLWTEPETKDGNFTLVKEKYHPLYVNNDWFHFYSIKILVQFPYWLKFKMKTIIGSSGLPSRSYFIFWALKPILWWIKINWFFVDSPVNTKNWNRIFHCNSTAGNNEEKYFVQSRQKNLCSMYFKMALHLQFLFVDNLFLNTHDLICKRSIYLHCKQ